MKIYIYFGLFCCLYINAIGQGTDMPGKRTIRVASSHDSTDTTVIGFSRFPLTKAQPECTLGYLIADAQLQAGLSKFADVSVSILNQGCIRSSYISSGPITMKQLYEALPYNNKLVIVAIPGQVLAQLCDLIAQRGGWPVSGISFTISNNRATAILINDIPLNQELIYNVVMPDYLASGGSGCSFLKDYTSRKTGIYLRTAVRKYITEIQEKKGSLEIELQRRIRYSD